MRQKREEKPINDILSLDQSEKKREAKEAEKQLKKYEKAVKLYNKQMREYQDNLNFYMAGAPAFYMQNPMASFYQQLAMEQQGKFRKEAKHSKTGKSSVRSKVSFKYLFLGLKCFQVLTLFPLVWCVFGINN